MKPIVTKDKITSYIIATINIILINNTTFAYILNLPTNHEHATYFYSQTKTPILSDNASQARPIGVGDVASGSLDLTVALPGFRAPVDVYMGIYAPDIFKDPILIWPDYTLHPLNDGIMPWKKAISQGLEEQLFKGVPLSLIPTGIYHFYCLVLPHGASFGLDETPYYLWGTYLLNPPCAHSIAPYFFNFNRKATLTALIENGTELALGELDENGTRVLEERLMPQETFCNVELDAHAKGILEHASGLAHDGNIDDALDMVLSYINTNKDIRQRAKVGASFLSLLSQTHSLASATTLLESLRSQFNKAASIQIAQSDTTEALTILGDATTLWAIEARSKALAHLRRLYVQALNDELRHLDPCMSDADALKAKIRSLVGLVQEAEILGAIGTYQGNETPPLESTLSHTLNKAIENFNSMARGQGLYLLCGDYVTDFSIQGANGYATLTGNLHSCDGIGGNWTGDIEIVITVPGKYACNAKAPIDIHPDPELLVASGTIDIEDINCTIQAANCTVNSVRDSLNYEISLDKEAKRANIYFSSTGAGLIDLTCHTNQPPQSSNYLWAIFWGDNRSVVELAPFEECTSNSSLW